MSSGTKEKLTGVLHQAKGKLKELAGKVTDNPKLQVEGVGEQIKGKAQEKIGQVKDVIGS